MSDTTKNLLTAIAALIGLLIIAAGSACAQQTFELQRGRIKNGKLEIFSIKRYPLAKAYEESLKLSSKLKPGEILIGPSVVEKVDVTVKDIDADLLTVSAEGFSSNEIAAIQRALEAWNVDIVRFVLQNDNGQIKIQRQATGNAALSVMKTIDSVLVSATVYVDPAIIDIDALQSTIAHEAGHWLGLSDSKNKDSVMYFKSRGRNRGNGHLGPTVLDFAALR